MLRAHDAPVIVNNVVSCRKGWGGVECGEGVVTEEAKRAEQVTGTNVMRKPFTNSETALYEV